MAADTIFGSDKLENRGSRTVESAAVPGRSGNGPEPANRRQPSRPAPLDSRDALGLRVLERSFERIERRSVDHVGQRTTYATSPLSRLRLVDQAQVSTGTHTVASKLVGGHAKSPVGIDDDLEPFSILRSRCTHDSRIVLRCWTLLVVLVWRARTGSAAGRRARHPGCHLSGPGPPA